MLWIVLWGCSSASIEELNNTDVDTIDFGDDAAAGDAVYELDTAADPDLTFTGYGTGGGPQNGTWSAYNVRVVQTGEAVTDLTVDVVVDMASVETGSNMLTRHLKTDDFFDVDTHPEGRFASTAITENEDGSFSVTGDLTLRGTTKSVTWTAQISTTEDTITSSAETTFSRWDFGLYPDSASGPGGDGVGDTVDLRYAVALTRVE